MASMQMCKPACESTYSETEKVKYSSSSKGCYSNEHKHHEHGSAGYSMTQAGHHVGGVHHKHPSHNNNCSQGSHLSEHKHHEHKPAGCATNQGGHHMGGMVHKHHEQKPAGCATNQGGHHMGGMVHKHPSHSTGHHGLTEKINGYFHHNGSSHDHKHGHGHQSSSHHASYTYAEKKEEHKICKSGHVKSEVHIKKKTSKKGNYNNDSSDSESDNEGCKKRC